jgi:hypothetical protein
VLSRIGSALTVFGFSQRTKVLTRAGPSLSDLLTMIGGNTMEPRSTRRAICHLLSVDVEIVDLDLGNQIRELTKDVNLYGYGVSTVTPFPTVKD